MFGKESDDAASSETQQRNVLMSHVGSSKLPRGTAEQQTNLKKLGKLRQGDLKVVGRYQTAMTTSARRKTMKQAAPQNDWTKVGISSEETPTPGFLLPRNSINEKREEGEESARKEASKERNGHRRREGEHPLLLPATT